MRILPILLLLNTCSFALTNTFHDSLTLIGMELCIRENYDQSLQYFDSLAAQYPNHPAGHFYTAAVIQSRMLDFETSQGRDEFVKEIKNAMAIAELWTEREPDNAQAWFYHGAARSYYSYQLAREKKYWRAITTGMDAIDDLQKCLQLDSTNCDALLGIGSYEYWRSYLTRKFAWLPFFSDNRAKGIEKLTRILECRSFSRWAAMSNLAWIHIEEKEYDKAIQISTNGLHTFPNSRFFLWPLGDALFKKADYTTAAQIYTKILHSVQSEAFNNHYNEILLYLKLGKCFIELGNEQQAFDYLQQALNIKPDKEVEKRAREKQEKAAELLAKLNRALD